MLNILKHDQILSLRWKMNLQVGYKSYIVICLYMYMQIYVVGLVSLCECFPSLWRFLYIYTHMYIYVWWLVSQSVPNVCVHVYIRISTPYMYVIVTNFKHV